MAGSDRIDWSFGRCTPSCSDCAGAEYETPVWRAYLPITSGVSTTSWQSAGVAHWCLNIWRCPAIAWNSFQRWECSCCV